MIPVDFGYWRLKDGRHGTLTLAGLGWLAAALDGAR